MRSINCTPGVQLGLVASRRKPWAGGDVSELTKSKKGDVNFDSVDISSLESEFRRSKDSANEKVMLHQQSSTHWGSVQRILACVRYHGS